MERTYTFGLRKDVAFGELDLGYQRLTTRTARTIGADGFTQISANSEIYLGFSLANLALKPSAYVYYSTDLEQLTVELYLD